MVDASSFSSTVPVPTVDATGVHIPGFDAIYAALLADYKARYGADLDTDFSDQDMQWIGTQALAMSKFAAAAGAVYSAFSPSTAQGAGLSSVVKVNGIARSTATYSTADILNVGVAGTDISGLVVGDGTYAWVLPAGVVIPPSGQITATATCTTIGAVQAAAGSISAIATPTRGWQSASNPSAATPGNPVETDAALRIRQTQSVALPSTTVLDGIVGAIEALSGVTRVKVYENDTNITDANQIPGHALAFVVDGGDAQQIANVIGTKKTMGAGTFGDVVETYTSTGGIPREIRFFRPTEVPISYAITVKPLKGFTALVQAAIQTSLVAWTDALDIGDPVLLTRAYVPAYSPEGVSNKVFEITSFAIARAGQTPAASDVTLGFNEAAYTTSDLVTINIAS